MLNEGLAGVSQEQFARESGGGQSRGDESDCIHDQLSPFRDDVRSALTAAVLPQATSLVTKLKANFQLRNGTFGAFSPPGFPFPGFWTKMLQI